MSISTMSFGDFERGFYDAKRGDQFTVRALRALFDYLCENSPDLDVDVIALCCTWEDHATALDAATENGFTFDWEDYEDEDDVEADALAYLREATEVIEAPDGSVVIVSF